MSSFFLKIFALFFMIVDHTGYILFPKKLIYRAIGRLALPLFAYQMAVGYSHTKNKKGHILKLLLFAIVCQIPYSLMINIYSEKLVLNIIFSFIISLTIIYLFENIKFVENKKINIFNILLAVTLTISLLLIAIFFNVDYSWYGVLLTVAFYFSLSKKWLSIILFVAINVPYVLSYFITQNIISLLGIISLFDIFFILAFNGEKGYKNSQIFYWIYFLHIFPLLAIRYLNN